MFVSGDVNSRWSGALTDWISLVNLAVAPIPELLEAGVEVGIGTDGAAANNDMDMFDEMDSVSKLHKVVKFDPTLVNEKTVLEMATIGGAKVLGLQDEIGSIELNKKADAIIINFNQPHLTPVYNLYSHLVYAVKGSDVETVIIDGKIIMENQKMVTINEQEVMEEVRLFQSEIINYFSK